MMGPIANNNHIDVDRYLNAMFLVIHGGRVLSSPFWLQQQQQQQHGVARLSLSGVGYEILIKSYPGTPPPAAAAQALSVQLPPPDAAALQWFSNLRGMMTDTLQCVSATDEGRRGKSFTNNDGRDDQLR